MQPSCFADCSGGRGAVWTFAISLLLKPDRVCSSRVLWQRECPVGRARAPKLRVSRSLHASGPHEASRAWVEFAQAADQPAAQGGDAVAAAAAAAAAAPLHALREHLHSCLCSCHWCLQPRVVDHGRAAANAHPAGHCTLAFSLPSSSLPLPPPSLPCCGAASGPWYSYLRHRSKRAVVSGADGLQGIQTRRRQRFAGCHS